MVDISEAELMKLRSNNINLAKFRRELINSTRMLDSQLIGHGHYAQRIRNHLEDVARNINNDSSSSDPLMEWWRARELSKGIRNEDRIASFYQAALQAMLAYSDKEDAAMRAFFPLPTQENEVEKKFAYGDYIKDGDGDIGFIVKAEPDAGGAVVWCCTDPASTKFGTVGNYYVTEQDELEKVTVVVSNTPSGYIRLEEFEQYVQHVTDDFNSGNITAERAMNLINTRLIAEKRNTR